MGLPDTYDIMWQCDRWLMAGGPRNVPAQPYKAIEEQQWKPEEFLAELWINWVEWSAQQTQLGESASFDRGYGWRVWYPNGLEVHSLMMCWDEIIPPIVGGVVYLGPVRRILQGKDARN